MFCSLFVFSSPCIIILHIEYYYYCKLLYINVSANFLQQFYFYKSNREATLYFNIKSISVRD